MEKERNGPCFRKGNFSIELSKKAALALSAQYTDQRSVGDSLAGDFSTHVFGAQAAMSYLENILSFAFTSTGENREIRNPFGSHPGYLSLIVENMIIRLIPIRFIDVSFFRLPRNTLL